MEILKQMEVGRNQWLLENFPSLDELESPSVSIDLILNIQIIHVVLIIRIS